MRTQKNLPARKNKYVAMSAVKITSCAITRIGNTIPQKKLTTALHSDIVWMLVCVLIVIMHGGSYHQLTEIIWMFNPCHKYMMASPKTNTYIAHRMTMTKQGWLSYHVSTTPPSACWQVVSLLKLWVWRPAWLGT